MNTRRLVIGWLIAAAFALTFSWSAVAQVRNRVIEPAVEIPTTSPVVATAAATESTVIRLDLAEPANGLEDPPDAVAPSTSSPNPDATGEGQPLQPPTTAPPTTEGTATTASPPTTTTTSTTTPPPTTTTTTSTTTTAPEVTTSSHTMDGGVVTISHTSGVVNLIAAIPQPGYTTEQRETGPVEVRIRFESDDHTSDFRARWQDGELEITINETGGDDD